MGHIVFGAPGIDSFHLHDRLQRELIGRGHLVETLLFDPVADTFWRHQGLATKRLAPEAEDPMRAPLDEFAANENVRLGLQPHEPRWRAAAARTRKRLASLLPGLVRWLRTARPDLVLLHGRRGAVPSLVQFAAREVGSRVLWTGEGLLPHTMQCDDRGLDADATASRSTAFDYRSVPSDPALLQASLTWLLGRATPAGLTRRDLRVPPLRARLGDAVPALLADGLPGLRDALFGWRRAAGPGAEPAPCPHRLPTVPYVAVLLQDRADERVRLDAIAPPSPQQLVAAAKAAARRIDLALHTVAVLPARGIHHTELRAIGAMRDVHVVAAPAAAEVAATALATFTIDHPLAVAALLAGAPVLHTGRALWGLRGVTEYVPTGQFADALPRAIAQEQPTLRERFLSWLLGHGHLWCSPTHPDHNGLVGLVQEIEARLGGPASHGTKLRYRVGPPWPLEAAGGFRG